MDKFLFSQLTIASFVLELLFMQFIFIKHSQLINLSFKSPWEHIKLEVFATPLRRSFKPKTTKNGNINYSYIFKSSFVIFRPINYHYVILHPWDSTTMTTNYDDDVDGWLAIIIFLGIAKAPDTPRSVIMIRILILCIHWDDKGASWMIMKR